MAEEILHAQTPQDSARLREQYADVIAEKEAKK
jgi:hypothetical protein